MPYVTSIERIANDEGKVEGKIEGKVEGKIQLLQELLGLPVMSEAELESMTFEKREALLLELLQQAKRS